MEHISDSITRHDRFQLEADFTYPLDPSRPGNEYYVEFYFFLPDDLGVTPENYGKPHFYSATHKTLRLKTPTVLLRTMGGPGSPLARLRWALNQYRKDPGQENRKSFDDQLKIFCSSMKDALRDEELFILGSLGSADLPLMVENYLTHTARIIRRFRLLMAKLTHPEVDHSAQHLYNLGDEFLSITANRCRYRLHQALREIARPELEPVRARIMRELNEEITYRSSRQYPSIPDPEGDNEEMVYREQTLEKVIAGVLQLHSSRRKDGVFLENLAFGIAAGLAMMFATAVAFIWQGLFLQQFSFAFFVILTIAYMGKDRIKALLQVYFMTKLGERIFDYRTTIYSELGSELGECREAVGFFPESKLPPEIVKYRNKSYLAELESKRQSGEVVLKGRRHILLHPLPGEAIFREVEVNGIVDMTRIDLRGLMERMEKPDRPLLVTDGRGGVRRARGKRVYHVNLVVKYGRVGGNDHYRRVLLILSRNGIQRIEFPPPAP